MAKLNIPNIIYLMGRLAPILFIFFFVMVSIFNQEWTGIVYLMGIMTSCVITFIISNTIQQDNSGINPICSIFETPLSKLPLSSVILGFTFTYIFFPMINTFGRVINKWLMIFMSIIIVIDIMFVGQYECGVLNIAAKGDDGKQPIVNIAVAIFLSYFIGFYVAFIMVKILGSSGNGGLLVFGTKSKGPLCNIQNSNKMVCKVRGKAINS